MVFKKIASKFNGKNEAQQKKERLSHLSRWISNTAASIESDVDELRQQTVVQGRGNGCRGYFLSDMSNDFDQYTRQDLQVLKPALQGLHDVCKKLNIALDISGFDILPRTCLATQNSWSTSAEPGVFAISVDTRREYNFRVNPFSDKVPGTDPRNTPKS